MVPTQPSEAMAARAPFRVPVQKLALATCVACLLAQVLSRVGSAAGNTDGGPLGIVLGQALWNAAQVGLLLLLLSLWRVRRRGRVAALAIATLACLPFAIYAISPGAWALTAILSLTCALAWTGEAGDLGVKIVDAPARGTPVFAKVEFLALICNLGSSAYNYNIGRGTWPNWASNFKRVAASIGFTPDTTVIAERLYGLGLPGADLPPYILAARDNPLASVAFLLIWTVLPVLYVLYFAAMAHLAKNTPGTRLQLALCAFAIFHFLFLTDIVDYQFGRGIVNPAAEWAHWSERFVWRIAILLPIYQGVASGHWRRGNGALGVAVHYALAIWGAAFFVYMVLICDGSGFYRFVTGHEITFVQHILGPYRYLGYPAALVSMFLFYGFATVALRCKRVVSTPIGPPS